ncbi:chain-length determining protein [Pseudomonas sp. P867]|uniref:chain-length determining protein n=1 Tax=unclassified Pseudomonas TaxID=196821 RepID=UPI000CDAC547|nr:MULTISPECIES: chain-length determining protein [unclassified Pseudomonas]MBY8972578.1 chain-length determining protein [Pseudomonas sp. P867]MCK3849748.1 chain-length determining protein [Pseudomonas sp. W2Jun17]UEH10080.1 chain-length determining protein [Pseudomonas sp. HN8-3]
MSSSLRSVLIPQHKKFDSLALVTSLWRQKIIIFSVGALISSVFAIYAFSVTPEYKVSSVLRPAAINELDALNRSEVYVLPPGEALVRVGMALESYEIRMGFFRSNQKLFEGFVRPGRNLQQTFEEFNKKSISLMLSDKDKADSLSSYLKLELTYPKGIDGVSILNGFVEYAIANERDHISADLTVIINNRLKEIDGRLAAARSNYDTWKEARIASLSESDRIRRAQLQDELQGLRTQLHSLNSNRIAELNEAITIAKKLNIMMPASPTSVGDDAHSGSVSMRTEINNQQIPLYFMGVNALEAERAVLLQRKSNDFTERRISQIAKELKLLESNREIEVLKSRVKDELFLTDVQPLRAEKARLLSVNKDMSNLKLVAIDKEALEPTSPISPNRPLLIIGGLLLGLVVGFAIAFFRIIKHALREPDL